MFSLIYVRFSLDKLEQKKPESEDEIHEHIDSIQSDDTDDEWTNIPTKYFITILLFLKIKVIYQFK